MRIVGQKSFGTLRNQRIMISCFLLLAIFSLTSTPTIAQEEYAAPRICDIRLIRMLGRYDEATQYLRDILENNSSSENLLRQTYNELVTTLYLQHKKSEASSTARTALLKFHDLEINPRHHPPAVGEIYANHRKEMFGSLELETDPPSCEVYRDGENLGTTPLSINTLLAGEHTLKIKKQYFIEKTVTLNIEPNALTKEVVVLKPRGFLAAGRKVRVGIELGVSYVSLNYKGDSNGSGDRVPFLGIGDAGDWERLIRYTGGVIVDVPVHDRVSFQPGVRYVQRGNRVSFGSTPVVAAGQYDVYHHYLVVPLFFKYYMGGAPGLFACGGGDFGYLIAAEISNKESGESFDIKDYMSNINLSFAVGAGYEHGFKNHSVFVSVQYFHGALGLLSDTVSIRSVDWRTREIKISTGFIY